jgi:hypothetical protein
VQAMCGIMNTKSLIRWKIGSGSEGSIIRCHSMYRNEILSAINDFNCKVIFIIHDLRDVAIFHAKWEMENLRLFLHDIYINHLKTSEDRLMASIKGIF